MTQVQHSPPTRLSKQRRYRRLLYGFIFGGVVLGLALRFLDYPVAGEAVYWLGIIGALAIWQGTSISLFDERDAALEQRASQRTLYVAAALLVVGASAARLLSYLSSYTIPAEIVGALYAYVVLFVIFAASYLWTRYRP